MSATSKTSEDWKAALSAAARSCAVLGWEKVEHRQHALLVITAIKALGK